MKIHKLDTGFFKLDGGAMFGVVPKKLWQRTNPADEDNLCTWAMRCMVIEFDNRLMLIDTGIGNKQSEKFFGYYHLQDTVTLDLGLQKLGFHRDDITDVFLTHLHFDHVGGAVEWDASKERLKPVFKNATYWSNEKHWKWATEPNDRENASFLTENIMPLQESGQLKFIDCNDWISKDVFPNMDVLFVNGHTEAQMLPMLNYKGKKIVFVADLLPSTGHIPLPFVIGYDTRPLLTLKEKKKFLDLAAKENMYLYMEHDAVNEVCTVQGGKKYVELKDTFRFEDILS
jgi:glyoxylase-like metal-dependent hydrolase (beta-lactamase superfamily II)